jgi:tripartite-type tricarboxylate transporter receptor subunit TctC
MYTQSSRIFDCAWTKMGGVMARAFGTVALAALAVVGGTAGAEETAASYPTHNVTIVVPFGPGGSADVYARELAQKLSSTTGKTFIVENRPGAGAVIGTQFVAKAPADGYTLLMISNTQTVNESLLRHKPYDLMRDFVAVAPVNETPLVLVVRSGLAAKTLSELLKEAKAAPGKLNFASSGIGTPYHMAGELLNSMADVDIVHIPYKSSGAARTDVMGGQVDMMFDAVGTMAGPIASGTVRPLATTGKTRSAVLPNVPTMAEAGLPDYTATLWLGLLAPKGTPQPIVDMLNQRITQIVNDPATRAQWAKNGVDSLTMSPTVFTEYLHQDIAKWRKIIKSAHIVVD